MELEQYHTAAKFSLVCFQFSTKQSGCSNLNPFPLLQSCIKVAMDFVSPENVGECFKLTEEFRGLPFHHRAKEDKLEVGSVLSEITVAMCQ